MTEAAVSFKPEFEKPVNTFDSTRKFPYPKGGSRPARISLIIDLGKQEREEYESQTNPGEMIQPKPIRQVAVFADLTSDTVDYGDEIGMQHYRLMMNNKWMNEIKGWNFAPVPPKDRKNGIWTFGATNPLAKIAKVIAPEVLQDGDNNMNVGLLLNTSFMINVDVDHRKSDTYKDDKGEPVVFTNVRYKGCSDLPEMPDGSVYPVAELNCKPMVITFDTVTEDNFKFIRKDILAKIKTALDYPGSRMEQIVNKMSGNSSQGGSQSQEQDAQEGMNNNGFDDKDDDIPF